MVEDLLVVASRHRETLSHNRFRSGVDVDDLWQTANQAQQLQVAVLLSNCWGNRVD